MLREMKIVDAMFRKVLEEVLQEVLNGSPTYLQEVLREQKSVDPVSQEVLKEVLQEVLT